MVGARRAHRIKWRVEAIKSSICEKCRPSWRPDSIWRNGALREASARAKNVDRRREGRRRYLQGGAAA